LLIGIGWLALYSPKQDFRPSGLTATGWLPRGNWIDILCWLAIGIFLALGVWAVIILGLRRSFLFRRLDDHLVTFGPYALVRHPQFLSAIGTTFFVTRLFNPAAYPYFSNVAYFYSIDVNWALFALALWLLSILEDRELAMHFGKEYEEYAQRVPRLFPN
jgi:protein-S-isoprenylcysteine O-methyltransferase Ste14